VIDLGLIVWLAIGAASHVYWVRRKYDYTTQDLATTFTIAALAGPLTWLVGWDVYGERRPRKPPRVLWKKKGG
jgi:hypothetical protein